MVDKNYEDHSWGRVRDGVVYCTDPGCSAWARIRPSEMLPPEWEVKLVPEELKPVGYTPYISLNAMGVGIALMTCTRCGAVVMLEPMKDYAAKHDAWHQEMEARIHG